MIELDPIVQVAVITVFGGGILAGIGWLGKVLYETRRTARSANKSAKETLYQVKNDHSINLRDDVDNKHTAVMHEISTLNSRLNGHLDRFNTMDKRDARIEDMLAALITERMDTP